MDLCTYVSVVVQVSTQVYTRDPRISAIFIPAWGSIGGSSTCSCDQITGVHQVYMSLYLVQSVREDNIRVKRRMVREDHGCINFAFVFACVVGKNPKTLN